MRWKGRRRSENIDDRRGQAPAQGVAGAITPVPGGVGPMTIACLLHNTVEAACRQHGIDRASLPS